MSGLVPHLRAWVLAAVLLLSAAPGQAHLLNMTKVQVTVNANQSVNVELQIDLKRAAGGGLKLYQLSQIKQPMRDETVVALLAQLRQSIDLRLNDKSVDLAVTSLQLPTLPESVFLDPLSWPMSTITLEGHLPALKADGPAQLTGAFLPGFHFEEPIALSFLDARDRHSMTRWLVTSQRSPEFPLRASVGSTPTEQSSVWTFFKFGFLHILPGGLDHILFVIGLYLGSRSIKSLLILVTTFTVAHSITLGLATVGVVHLDPNIVEPLISASIVWVAIENLLRRHSESRYRPAVVFAFGLVHGMGFAAALSELKAPAGQFLQAILSFNLGIEAAQLAVIALVMFPSFALMQSPSRRRYLVVPASLLVATVAAVWTLQRLFYR